MVILPAMQTGTPFLQMQFDYEIPVDEYAAAQLLYHTARDKTTLVTRGLFWVFVGLFYVLIAVTRWVADWGPVLLFLTGAWFVYAGINNIFPTRHFRRAYPESEFAGKTYHAELEQDGFSVAGDSCGWHARWSEVRFKGENKLVFMFFAKSTIFIFGKKYLTDEQQKEIRRLAAMP